MAKNVKGGSNKRKRRVAREKHKRTTSRERETATRGREGSPDERGRGGDEKKEEELVRKEEGRAGHERKRKGGRGGHEKEEEDLARKEGEEGLFREREPDLGFCLAAQQFFSFWIDYRKYRFFFFFFMKRLQICGFEIYKQFSPFL